MRDARSVSWSRWVLLLAALQSSWITPWAQSPAAETPRAVSAPSLDEGLLDPAWFSTDVLEFRQSGKPDYFWVRPGFVIDGRTLQFTPWPQPELPAARDERDVKAAQKLNGGFPGRLAEKFAKELVGKARVVAADGDLRVYGRIVDCNAGTAIVFVWPHYTFELKFVDVAGELQVAIHTRLVGKALKMNYGAWAGMIARPFRNGIESAWLRGERPES